MKSQRKEKSNIHREKNVTLCAKELEEWIFNRNVSNVGFCIKSKCM